ncbi:hypothetical protein AGLY_013516 [Aphis glycines]|uniref:Uncharacterized protein n=1 Tax=Aphis glycines TaxID=307491 RepID=A0A6G0T6J0_APHGL|nr:hypothetical protein AGLY_013516 [Aphis glycines]
MQLLICLCNKSFVPMNGSIYSPIPRLPKYSMYSSVCANNNCTGGVCKCSSPPYFANTVRLTDVHQHHVHMLPKQITVLVHADDKSKFLRYFAVSSRILKFLTYTIMWHIIRSSIIDLIGDDETGTIISITSSVEEPSSDEDNDDDDFSSASNTNDSYSAHDIIDLTVEDDDIISITSSVEEPSSDEDNDDDDFSSASNTNDSYSAHDIIDLTVEDDDIISITSSVEKSSSDEEDDGDDDSFSADDEF